jgi:hypothetical protein
MEITTQIMLAMIKEFLKAIMGLSTMTTIFRKMHITKTAVTVVEHRRLVNMVHPALQTLSTRAIRVLETLKVRLNIEPEHQRRECIGWSL